MLILIQANGIGLRSQITKDEFLLKIQAVAPSPWISIDAEDIPNEVLLNIFTLAYVYEQ